MLDEFGFIWYNNYRNEVLNLLVEYDATSQPDLNRFAKHLNDAVPNNLEWNTFSAFDKCDWPRPDKYYWVIGITKNYDGSEWWKYKRAPTEPFETKDFDLQKVNIYD